MLHTKRKWKIHVIHHSHTDIGYTERQEKIEQFHVDFIRQAIQISDAAHSGEREEWTGFKWTCETFWAVERFWEKADEAARKRFVDALKRGDLELSGTYLNMTELIDFELLAKKWALAGAFGRSLGIQVNSAMTADINGYSWGYAQAMYDAGIENLLSCVHPYHGIFPLGRKQTPFYWETPQGNRVLVWNGEHYMFGNDLGLSPGAVLSYTIRDELNGTATVSNHWHLAETRIGRYLEQLEKEDYPYDFVLVNVMGLLRDNSAPNGSVMAFIKQWNEKHGSDVQIEMTTLNSFFRHVRQQKADIPTYRGDWPDWWSDGVASTAVHTQVFRDAQRTLHMLRRLNEGSNLANARQLEEAEYQLTMYAEHTWGYHSSITEPWHQMVQTLGVRKEAYAANASRAVYTVLDGLYHAKGEEMLSAGIPFRYAVVNPYSECVESIAQLYLESWELSQFEQPFEVIDEATGNVIAHQLEKVSRGNQVTIVVHLDPKEERFYRIRPAHLSGGLTTSSTGLHGNDRVLDLQDLYQLQGTDNNGIIITEDRIESPYVSICWEPGLGITSWVDKVTGKSLLKATHQHGAFTPVYELTKADSEDKMFEVRSKMGRNRKGMHAQRSIGELIGAKEIVNGSLYGAVKLTYRVTGMSHYSLYVKVYRDLPRVDISVRLHKDSVWDPENVYISLPFGSGSDEDQLWLDKAGASIRPGVDQLPGTCLDFYCIQEGLALLSEHGGLIVSTPDTPLIQTGPIGYGKRLLQGQQQSNQVDSLYVWALTNYWETNFKATLGGFYEFRYRLQWGEEWTEPTQALRQSRILNTELPAYRTRKVD